MKKFLLLSATAILMACGGAKLTTSNYQIVKDTSTKTERDQYIFEFSKKPETYFQVVEVKLLNEEAGMEESVQFQRTEPGGTKSILDDSFRGYAAFAIVASKPKKDDSVLATSAIIVYKAEENGPNKYYKVKKIGQ